MSSLFEAGDAGVDVLASMGTPSSFTALGSSPSKGATSLKTSARTCTLRGPSKSIKISSKRLPEILVSCRQANFLLFATSTIAILARGLELRLFL